MSCWQSSPSNTVELCVYSIRAEMELRVLFFVLVALITHVSSIIKLNGDWQVTVEDLGKSFTGHVPGGIYTDLRNANLIPDSFKESNDVNQRWIGNSSVTYTKEFQVSEEDFNAPTILLIFEGLDTFSTIYVNENEIGKTSNMFLRHMFDVKDRIKIGSNNVTVTFASAVKVAEDLYDKQAANYTVPPKCVPKSYNGECHVNHVRKMQASFGWDWGPAFPSAGIWKDVTVYPIDDAVILDTTVDVKDRGDEWHVTATSLFAVGPKNQSQPITGTYKLWLNMPYGNVGHDRAVALSTSQTFSTDSVTLRVPKANVSLWWPNGYGDQALYTWNVALELDIVPGTYTWKSSRIGFRKIELVQDPLDKGRTFYFRVNDVPIFAKGSNWIPASVFPELSSRHETVAHLMESAREANMNMLRVWGGGLYESDIFYDLADEYGIMIWQDFMFACSMYPTNTEFLDSVRDEVAQNVNRLKHHPSIVVWAGNNENEAAIYGNWYGTGNAPIYREDYVKLYVDVVKREVEALDDTRPFLVSSPSDGLFTDENGFVGPDPYSNYYGDVHYYNYLSNGWNINQYPITRFASEYGFQSIPSMETLASATDNIEDLHLDSEFLGHRQHLPDGWSFMKLLISKNFAIPRSNDSHRDLADYIYLSQINQAVSVKIQTESYRQMRSTLYENGEGFTMGALYWQLNDVWQAPSWSSIEFGGRWKMLHYYAVEFFAPIIVTPRVSRANDLTIYIVSDKLSPIPECTLSLNVYRWNSSQPVYTRIFPHITMTANSAQSIVTLWMNKLLEEASCGDDTANKNCFVELVLEDDANRLIAPINYAYPAPLKDVSLPYPVIEINVDPTPIPGKFSNYLDYKVEVRASEIALFVWLEIGEIRGRFSDNGFHVIGRNKSLVFHADEAVTAEQLRKGLKVKTLDRLYFESQ